MKIKIKRSSYMYPLTIGKEYKVLNQQNGYYQITTDKGSALWVSMRAKGYEFEIVGAGKYKKGASD